MSLVRVYLNGRQFVMSEAALMAALERQQAASDHGDDTPMDPTDAERQRVRRRHAREEDGRTC